MTKKQRQKIIYEACEVLETDYEHFACNALDMASKQMFSKMRSYYCKFYWDKYGAEAKFGVTQLEKNRSARIISLLLFHESYESVLER